MSLIPNKTNKIIEQLNISEEDYRGLDMPSSSLFKGLDEYGPTVLKYPKKYDSEDIIFGDLVDCMLLTPERTNEKFYNVTIEKPTGQLLILAKHVLENLDNITENTVLAEIETLNLWKIIKDTDKKIAKFNIPLFWNYIKAAKESENKIIVSPEIYEEALNAVQILKTHQKTNNLFNKPDCINQCKFKFFYKGIWIKVMLDKLIIDHENAIIYPLDLKCTSVRQKNFRYIFQKLKYYLQGSLYRFAVNWWAQENYPEYQVSDFKFIVYSRSNRYPFIRNMQDEWYTKGLFGFEDSEGRYYKGINDLIKDYKFYKENQDCNIEREFVINDELNI